MRRHANTMMVRAAMTAAAVELPADAREYLPRKWRVTDTEALRMTNGRNS